MVWRVAAVGEPAGGVGGGDGGEGGPGGGAEVVVGACLTPAQRLLDLGERLFDRIEVRRGGRQREEAGAAGLDGRADGRAVVGLEVVGDDDLARTQGRRQEEAYVALEARGGHGPIEPQARADAVER